ncbi:hypothetical protein L6452_31836 [Arctium lappa]|uniref:Uncharacterized protein n=1 Tax=Arctium lappa TaxID=4217 RepID=A0ACB8Z2U0_ARCLA|nr:hypothetical protein L6452_31836 [Arctium lappa]
MGRNFNTVILKMLLMSKINKPSISLYRLICYMFGKVLRPTSSPSPLPLNPEIAAHKSRLILHLDQQHYVDIVVVMVAFLHSLHNQDGKLL